MSTTKNEIINNIGRLLLASARDSAPDWEYAGMVYATREGGDVGGESFLYLGRDRLLLEDLDYLDDLFANFDRFREITRVDGDDYWIKCKAVLRKSDSKLKILFEFNDWSRWSITPSNVNQAYEILVGDIFPEALE